MDPAAPPADAPRMTRRRSSNSILQTAPVTWAADAGSDGSALYLGEKKLVVGTTDGRGEFMSFNIALSVFSHYFYCLFCVLWPLSLTSASLNMIALCTSDYQAY